MDLALGFWTLFFIYLTGFFLIILDIFLPGGILATFGGILLAIGVAATYYQHGAGWGTTALLSSLGAATAMVVVGYQLISKTSLGRHVFLDPRGSRPGERERRQLAELVGKQGVTLTDLRPAGRIQIDDEPYDAITTGRFIPAGRKIAVVSTEMNYVIVDEV